MKISISLLAVFISMIFISCGNDTHRDFTMGKDGLYYKYSSQRLYSGTIIDTVDVIVQYSVIWGKKNGQFITRYPNGQVEKVGFIKNNLNVGEWKYYYPDGTLECKGRYEKSKAQGKWIYYYPNGTIKTEGCYINSSKNGEWIIYDNEGKIINIRFYSNGFFLGVQNLVS
jgi:antitoxin component YwqK of YwqJK toxin-antitoxin module